MSASDTSTRPSAGTEPKAANSPTRVAGPQEWEQVRRTAETMLAEGQVAETFEFLLEALAAVLRISREQAMLIEKLRRSVRRSSERVDPGQLALLMEELLASSQESALDPKAIEAESRSDAALDHEIEEARRARKERQDAAAGNEPEAVPVRKRRGWQAPGVAPIVHMCVAGPDERTCGKCGREMAVIGHEVATRLEFVPGHFERHEYHQEKLACGQCKKGVVTVDGAPPAVIPGSTAGASALAQVVVSKHLDKLPLVRQHGIYARDGIDLPVSTMADWVSDVGDMLAPIGKCIENRVLRSFLLQTDASGLPVLDPDSPANIVRGTIWCYVGDMADVVFRYTPTGEAASGPWAFLESREGYVQADASNVFDRLYNGKVAQATEVGCFAHWRRKFVALQETDPRVAYPIKLIGRLYRVERLADLRELGYEERRTLRLERNRPTLDSLRNYCVRILAKEPPSNKVAQAMAYGINHWQALTRFMEDGRLPLDNNRCERELRQIALTRNNSLFAGSHAAAERMATIFTVLRTCVLRGLPPVGYLTDLLPKLARGAYADRLEELLPDRWLASTKGAAPT
jgi:transposase